jgi:hypothetical protein
MAMRRESVRTSGHLHFATVARVSAGMVADAGWCCRLCCWCWPYDELLLLLLLLLLLFLLRLLPSGRAKSQAIVNAALSAAAGAASPPTPLPPLPPPLPPPPWLISSAFVVLGIMCVVAVDARPH